MSKTKIYKSDIKAAIHQTASDLRDAGLIDKQTMRRFDESCLTPIHDFTAEEIRVLREREDVKAFCKSRRDRVETRPLL